MSDKERIEKSQNLFPLLLENRDCPKGLERVNRTHKVKEEVFIDFWAQSVEYFIFLMQRFPMKELMDRLERAILISGLSKFEGHQKKTAKFLGMKPTTLNEKIKKHNILFRKIPYED